MDEEGERDALDEGREAHPKHRKQTEQSHFPADQGVR